MSVESAHQALAVSEHLQQAHPDLSFDHLLALGLTMSYQKLDILQEKRPASRRYQVRQPHHIIKDSKVLVHTRRAAPTLYRVCSLPRPDAQGRLTVQVQSIPDHAHIPAHTTTLHLADYGVVPNQDGLWHQENWLELVAIPADWPIKKRLPTVTTVAVTAPKPAEADLVASPAAV